MQSAKLRCIAHLEQGMQIRSFIATLAGWSMFAFAVVQTGAKAAVPFLLGCALSFPGAARAETPPRTPAPALNVERVEGAEGGKVYRITASGTVAATQALAWQVLTDYDHLADFVPDLKSARVVNRDGARVIVDQHGAARFLFFSHDIHLRVQIHEQAPDRIDVSLIDGDMKVYRCRWELVSLNGGGTRVLYQATIEPKFLVPPIVGTSLVRKDIAAMLTAVFLRMETQASPH